MSNKIALIGAGVMGQAIGTRLLETGNSLCVFDRNQPKMERKAQLLRLTLLKRLLMPITSSLASTLPMPLNRLYLGRMVFHRQRNRAR